jgi:hypothetical protein
MRMCEEGVMKGGGIVTTAPLILSPNSRLSIQPMSSVPGDEVENQTPSTNLYKVLGVGRLLILKRVYCGYT